MIQFRIDSYSDKASDSAPVAQEEFGQFFQADAYASSQSNLGLQVVYLREVDGQGFRPLSEAALQAYLLDD